MTQRFPSLNALRFFEAAGRRGSFTLAANELNVTPGAVSRQIKFLEEVLKLDLFERGHREVTLTGPGEQYLECLTDAFERIELGTEKLLHSHAEQRLNICCSMTLTMRWLVPRLGRFHSAYPTRDLCMNTPIPEPGHLKAGRASLAVHMGKEDWEDTRNERLFDIKLIPVCSPAYLAHADPMDGPDGLAGHTLLSSLVRPEDWPGWAQAAGANLNVASALQFQSSSLAFEAAINGVGIAIGQLALVLDDLRSGRLVTPFKAAHSDGRWVSLSVRPEFATNPAFVEFRDWIRGEVETYLADQTAFCAERGIAIL